MLLNLCSLFDQLKSKKLKLKCKEKTLVRRQGTSSILIKSVVFSANLHFEINNDELTSPFCFKGTAAPAFEPRGRTMNAPSEERKGGNNRGRDSSEDASLTREKNRSQALKAYTVVDGEFTSFPEIQVTSA